MMGVFYTTVIESFPNCLGLFVFLKSSKMNSDQVSLNFQDELLLKIEDMKVPTNHFILNELGRV